MFTVEVQLYPGNREAGGISFLGIKVLVSAFHFPLRRTGIIYVVLGFSLALQPFRPGGADFPASCFSSLSVLLLMSRMRMLTMIVLVRERVRHLVHLPLPLQTCSARSVVLAHVLAGRSATCLCSLETHRLTTFPPSRMSFPLL